MSNFRSLHELAPNWTLPLAALVTLSLAGCGDDDGGLGDAGAQDTGVDSSEAQDSGMDTGGRDTGSDTNTEDAGVMDSAMPDADAAESDAGRLCGDVTCAPDQFCGDSLCLLPSRYSITFRDPDGVETVYEDDNVDPTALLGSGSTLRCAAPDTSFQCSVTSGDLLFVMSLNDWDRESGAGVVNDITFSDSVTLTNDPSDTECEIVALPNDPDPGALVVSTSCRLHSGGSASENAQVIFDLFFSGPL